MEKRRMDVGLFAVMRGGCESIAKEMSVAVERSAWSSVIALCRDFSVVILDSDFRLVTVPEEILPGQAVSLHSFVENMAKAFEGDIHEGDVLMSNDCDIGNLHVAEIAFATPVFYEGEIIFWTAIRGHMADMGAPAPVSVYPYARDTYSEGLKIPPIKVFDKGRERKDVTNLYVTNTRLHSLNYGDLMAHIAAILLGRDRLVEFLGKYGKEAVRTFIQELFDYTDRMVANEIRSMKQGTYYGEDWVDTNSFGTKNIPIKVKLTIKDDMWIVDLSECGPALIGSANCGLGMTEGVIASSLGYMIDPQIPKNWGLCKHYEIIAPEGSIINAKRPFSTARGTSGASDTLYHALMKALAGACPERVPAGCCKLAVNQFAGVDYRDGRNTEWGYVAIGEQTGGGGGSYGADGWSCMGDFEAGGGLKAIPIEMIELLYPLLVEQLEIVTDSMGAGKWCGAPGSIFTVKPYNCSKMVVGTDHTEIYNGCYGALGGKQSPGGCNYEGDPKNTEKRIFRSIGVFYIEPGHSYTSISTGGGGYGDPLERDPELVMKAVRDEFISTHTAREDYGVVLDPRTLEIAHEATEKLRSKIRSTRGELPLVTATEPGNASMLRDMMTEKDEWVDLDRSVDTL